MSPHFCSSCCECCVCSITVATGYSAAQRCCACVCGCVVPTYSWAAALRSPVVLCVCVLVLLPAACCCVSLFPSTLPPLSYTALAPAFLSWIPVLPVHSSSVHRGACQVHVRRARLHRTVVRCSHRNETVSTMRHCLGADGCGQCIAPVAVGGFGLWYYTTRFWALVGPSPLALKPCGHPDMVRLSSPFSEVIVLLRSVTRFNMQNISFGAGLYQETDGASRQRLR